MSDTEKYDFDLTDYSTTGWNGILKGSIEDVDTHLHTRILATYGETIAIGDPVYLKSDGKYWKAKAAAAMIPCAGLALEAGSADDEKRIQRIGPMAAAATWGTLTVGGKLYVSSATAGFLTHTKTALFSQAVGRAFSAATIFVWIEDVLIVHYGTADGPTPTNYDDGIIYLKYTA